MANGITHDRVNYLLGLLISGALFVVEVKWILCLGFYLGWLFSTYIFSPDTDIMPKKRTGPLQFILFPYSIMFKHRGSSHRFLWGTLGRVIYGIVIIGLLILVFSKMDLLNYSASNYFESVYLFFKNFNLNELSYQIVLFLFGGMVLADGSHLIIDKLS